MSGGGRWLLCLAGVSAMAACAGEEPTATPQPDAVALDLYVLPSVVVAPGAPGAGWPFVAGEITLSTQRTGRAEVPIPDGGRTLGRVVQVRVLQDGQEIVEDPVVSRVVATGEDGLSWVGTVEAGFNSHDFVLRTPAGRYDVWVEPYDRSFIPQLIEGVQLPDSELVVAIPEGIQVRGVITDGDPDAPQLLAGVQVVPRDPVTLRRSGTVSTTGEPGAFSVRVPPGKHGLWLRRDAATGPIPATRARIISVGQGSVPNQSLTLAAPELSQLGGEVRYVDRFIDGVEVTATRITGQEGPAGALSVTTVTGTGTAPNPGTFNLSLPAGSYTLTVLPPSSAADPLAPATWAGGQPVAVPTSTDTLSISLDAYLVGLRGELLEDDGATRARGTSLLFLPSEPERPIIGTMALGQLATFTVGLTPPGGEPIALGPGSHEVIVSPPIGSANARELLSLGVTLGQTRLDLPGVPRGYTLYGQLTGGDFSRFEGAVIKAVPAGTPTWGVRWGPGPDPRDVVAEALVAADGTFELRLPRR